MAERELFWAPSPAWETAQIDRPGLRVTVRHGLGQVLVSGDLDAARAALAPEAPEAGLWTLVEAPTFWVRMARDRALLVATQAGQVEDGWRAEGYAVSAADGSRLVLELDGEDLRRVIAEAVAADLEAGSRSAAVTFAGVPALLYRTAAGSARLHVEQALAPYLWRWLESRPG